MTENELTGKIIDCSYKVYFGLGPGLLESVYQKVLLYELRKAGLHAETEVPIPIIYNGINFGDTDLRADIIVENQVILELKSVEEMKKVYYKQLLTYLRMTKLHLGLLINFNTSFLKDSIHRVING